MFLIMTVRSPSSQSNLTDRCTGGTEGRDEGMGKPSLTQNIPSWQHVCYSSPLGDSADAGTFLNPFWGKAVKH